MKKSEKEAKAKLRQHQGVIENSNHVPVVTKRGGGLQFNQGQAVSQGFGSGALFDLVKRKKKG